MARHLAAGTTLVLATHNRGKLAEMAALVQPFGITVVAADTLGLAEPEENAPDFIGNAEIKALAAALATGRPALADDSGFCVAALDGAPGIYSARWAGPERDFSAAMARVAREIGNNADRRAHFICGLALAWPDRHVESFLGRVDGTVAWPPRGGNGFGYDPMFRPNGSALTFGEMTAEQKGPLSHRARAFAKLSAACLGTADECTARQPHLSA
ncbi:MAG: RdgB/HAM1 family non-canonical purine NTP pyrophosphatase [Acetobacteraceae bacterium]